MTSKEKGNKLEDFVVSYLQEIDPKARRTKNSGGSTELADVMNKYFMVECKFRETKDITLQQAVWKKLCGEIPVGSLKIPMYILQNKDKNTFTVLDINDFMRLMEDYLRLKNNYSI